MFGDMMGNMEEKQKEMQQKLQTIELSENVEGITITANAAREILNISIADTLEDKEEIEDLLVVAMNNILSKISEEEAKESQKMISNMLPPGMGGLFGG